MSQNLKFETTKASIPRSYSRGLEINGTKEMYVVDTNSIILDDGVEYWECRRDTADLRRSTSIRYVHAY